MLPIQNLLRRKVRTFFALMGIAVGISAVVSIVSTAKGLRRQFYRIADQFAYDVIVQKKGVPSPLLSQVTTKDKDVVSSLEGVQSASLLSIYLVRRDDEAHPQPIIVLGMEPGSELLSRYEIVKGRTLQPGDKNVMLLGELGAQQTGASIGSRIATKDDAGSYEVVGIFRPPVEGVDFLSGQAVANIAFLAEQGNQANMVVAHLRTKEQLATGKLMERAEVQSSIAAVVSSVASTKALRKLEGKAFKTYLDSFKQAELIDKFAWAMSFLAALVGGIGIANTMLMSVFERTREIGLLRAVGWSRSRILSLIVLEGLALSIVGGLLGIPLGYLEVMAAAVFVELGWIQVQLDPQVAYQAIGLAIAIGVVGSLYPGIRAANLEPTEALRYE